MPTPPGDVAHLLRRAGFGGSHAQVAELARLDIHAIVDRVLDVRTAPPVVPPAVFADPLAGGYEQWVGMTHTWLERMRTSPAPIVEKMVLFWHGHLTSSIYKVEKPTRMWEQLDLYRSMGMGNVHDLVQAAAINPAMLRYLDNDTNVDGAPNENFARELMELFTLGVGHYTQDDVVAAARAWTGHGRDWKTGEYVFRRELHDGRVKSLFGIMKNWDGPDVITEILMGSKRDVAARFLVTKLWTFLAHPNPDPALVSELASRYLGSGMNITALLRAIFLRPEFYSVTAKRGLVRSPIEYMVAAMKGAELGCDVAHPEWWVEGMGQVPYSPPNVSGWRPNGYWVSTSATWAKIGFANHLRWKINETGLLRGIEGLPPAESVKAVLRQFGVDRAGPQTKAALERYVARERGSDRWAERPNLILLVLLSPEMHLA